MAKPLMAKATAVWLVDNTTISFKQIADFVELHELEVQGIADGVVATGVKGFNPIANNQLTHWNINNISPIDPVALGLCKQTKLDAAVQKAAAKKAAAGEVMNDDERRKLVCTKSSLGMPPEPKIPAAMDGLEAFTLIDEDDKKDDKIPDAESFFNLPGSQDNGQDNAHFAATQPTK
jgi:hypothetical protein